MTSPDPARLSAYEALLSAPDPPEMPPCRHARVYEGDPWRAVWWPPYQVEAWRKLVKGEA